jgi:hypothetical protein
MKPAFILKAGSHASRPELSNTITAIHPDALRSDTGPGKGSTRRKIMKTRFSLSLALAALAGSVQIATAQTAAAQTATVQVAAASHCGTGETIYFNAAVDGSPKIVSLCGSASLEGDGAWLEYRFGAPGHVELQYPSANADLMSAFTVRRYTRPRTTYLKLEFDNGGFNYAILEGHGADEDPQSTASLRVRRLSDGEDVTDLDLVMSTEPLSIMQLEYKVRTEPFDE